jgi:hypothetical protein
VRLLRQHTNKIANKIATVNKTPTTIPAIVLPGKPLCEPMSSAKTAAGRVGDSVGEVREVTRVVALELLPTDAVALMLMLNI